MSKQINFMLTAFRDGLQSVYGGRVFSKDYLSIVEEAAHAGITHFEAGGGAMFQAPIFFCNENSFDIMDNFRAAAGPNANLQTLARGINLIALDSQPSDIIKLHSKLFKKHGMTTIRNFDALNDVNNLIYSGKCIKEAGLKHEVCVTMMELPPGCTGAHTPEFYINTLKQILDTGIEFDSICFKDASGTSTPRKVYETVRLARQLVGDKVHFTFHSHSTAATGTLAYNAAIEAGIDQVDLSIAPVSGGSCQPDILTMWHALRGTGFDLGIDVNKIIKLRESFKNAMKDYFLPPEATIVEPLIPFFPMPGGALTANTQLLRDNGLLDRYPEVIAAMGEAVAKGGFGTSVTPVSQFYFQQAFNNVMFGKWKQIAPGYGKMLLGYFGKTPVIPDPVVTKIAMEQLKLQQTTESPLAIDDRDPKKGVAAAKKLLEEAKLPTTEENIFIAACCTEKGIAFLKGEGKIGVRKNGLQEAPKNQTSSVEQKDQFIVTINNKEYDVKVDKSDVIVNGQKYSYEAKSVETHAKTTSIEKTSSVQKSTPIQENKPQQQVSQPKPAATAAPVTATATATPVKTTPVACQLPGLVLRVEKKVGDSVAKGEIIVVMESMKMEMPLVAPIAGTIATLLVTPHQQIQADSVVATIR